MIFLTIFKKIIHQKGKEKKEPCVLSAMAESSAQPTTHKQDRAGLNPTQPPTYLPSSQKHWCRFFCL